jgi:glycosyltransferase involved in cell wall biosynthesis
MGILGSCVPYYNRPTASARSTRHGAFEAGVRATRSARRAADGSRELYEFAARVGDRFGVTHLVDLECGDGRQLAPWRSRFEVLGLDVPAQVEVCRRRHNFGEWQAWSPNTEIALPGDVIEAAVVVWRAREAMSPPELDARLRALRAVLGRAPVALAAVPIAAPEHLGPDGPRAPVLALGAALERAGLEPDFLGLAPSPPTSAAWAVAILGAHAPRPMVAPADFRVAAIMTTFNEQDIIRPTIERLLADGITVYLIDNWSTDATAERVGEFVERGLVSVERFPPDGPPTGYAWTVLLSKVADVAASLDVDWCIHHDVDERRDPPWPGMGLRDAIFRVDRAGFNAIDHTLVEFRPIDDLYPDGAELSEYFRKFEWVPSSASAPQVQAWKNERPVDLATSGGHDVGFPGRRVFPFNFLLRHYPIRSQQHGERKVFEERQSRYPEEELDRGWHYHYQRLRRGHQFVRDPNELIEFVDGEFHAQFLLPRLARIGVPLRPPSRRARARAAAIATMRRLGLLSSYLKLRRRLRRAGRAHRR